LRAIIARAARCMWMTILGALSAIRNLAPDGLGVPEADFWPAALEVRPRPSFHGGATQLLQLRILGFGLLEDRDVRIGIFPEREETLIGGFCYGLITRQRIGSA